MITQLLMRKKKPVIFWDQKNNEPVCTQFGYSRGTPIDRYYIDKFLDENIHLIKGSGLEVGDNYYFNKYYTKKVQSVDVLHPVNGNEMATIIGDLTKKETLPASCIDCFICTQVFNFIYDVQKAVEGAYHVLKPGGTLLATVNGIAQISRFDMDRWGDYWRFTTASMQKLISDVFADGEIDIVTYGNVLAATSLLYGLCVEDLPDRSLLDHRDDNYQVIIAIKAKKVKIKC